MQEQAAYQRRSELRTSLPRYETIKAVQLRVWYEGGEVVPDKTGRGTRPILYTVFLDRSGGSDGIGPFNRIQLLDWANTHLKD